MPAWGKHYNQNKVLLTFFLWRPYLKRAVEGSR